MATILVVDDEKVIREGLRRLLTVEGYQVLTAENGQKALETLACEDVNIILCDLKMPVMGALEVLQEVKVRFPCLPLVVITGHGTVDNAVECMRQGAYDFITKPFSSDHLLLIVKRAVEKEELERRTRTLQEEQARNLYDLAVEQSRLKTIVNCMAEGVLVTNRDLEVVLYNPALRRLLDIPQEPERPAALEEYITDEHIIQGLKTLVVKAPTEAGFISEEFTKGKNYIRSQSASINSANELLGTVSVFHDITRFKELDAMKSSFVNMVSHELRSPLGTIKQQIAVILEGLAGDLNDKQRDMLGRSQTKIENLLNLINDLLDVAKIESGRGFEEHVPLDLHQILHDMIEFMQEKAQNQQVDLKLETDGDIPLIQADRRSMEEIFNNLISNAINYSPDGGQVRVKMARRDGFLEIVVSDTGVGIDPEELPKIFEKFYRVKHPKTRQVVGTGLGLAIVKGVVDSHGGSIKVKSEPGAGTTFCILLPALEERAQKSS
jgi:two-component system, OmpR family, phosphate regulon sensor histidine kinase PhoR